MQNVTYMTYRLLFQLLFDLIQEHHVTEKKEEEPVALNAFELISRSAGLNLGNLFDSEQVWNAPDSSIVTWNVESEMCDKLKSPWFSKDIASWLLYELEFPLFFLVYFFSNYHACRVVPNIYYVFFIQILQVAPSLHMVEVRKAKGDTLEFQKVYLACKDHANKWKHTYLCTEEVTEIHNFTFLFF